jgi:hypothetical protein
MKVRIVLCSSAVAAMAFLSAATGTLLSRVERIWL